ncbi:hypothetical protein I6G56_23405 [Burkholderia humptydooensis]|uniref:Uncharacterized protein n=2 Tax=Burkholderia humptydooensis TaxID=430531 RepID=A0A7U4SUI0_9BURK|nr:MULTISPECIES: hypothetical protein [Burkholderia]AJY40162.1 putative exported protein [Burkholderia sp. 2002721687]ALX45891.1 hypothetical protein AQ610_26085 [Burkholderia humptydooensis]QPS47381.1 hypothetical protein I6G56_23405 [Burkholderia humptydooensis]
MKTINRFARRAALVCCAGSVLASGAAFAQVDLQSLGASLLGGGAAQQASASGASGMAQVLQSYVGANQQVLAGQASLASAMGLTGAAGQAQHAAGLLTGGGASALTPGALSQVGGAQQSVAQALTQAFASGGASGAASGAGVDKAAFTRGLASLGEGVTQYSQLQSGLGNLGASNPASLLQSGLDPNNLRAASYIAQNAPSQLQSIGGTLGAAVQYAMSHGISVPSVASSALKLLP